VQSKKPTAHQHTAKEERDIREAALDETLEATFPASDPSSSLPNPDDHEAVSRKERRKRSRAEGRTDIDDGSRRQ